MKSILIEKPKMPLVYLNRIKNIAAKSYSLFLNNTNNGE